MRLRVYYVSWVLAAGIGGLLIGAPAHGQGSPAAAIVAVDIAFRTAGGAPAAVTVAPGSAVSFAYPSGNSAHNVVFTGPQPSSCRLVQPPGSSLSAAPLPATPSAPGWQGDCTFAAEGTYNFVCGLHGSSMTGSVVVGASGGSPPPPPPPPPPDAPPAAPPPVAGTSAAASGLRVRPAQRGSTIGGSVQVTHAGSRLLTRAFARRRALSGGRSRRQGEVGRQLRRSVGPGRVTFSVRLTPAGRRALRRNGRLAISLRLRVTPPAGAAYTAARAVTLRPPA